MRATLCGRCRLRGLPCLAVIVEAISEVRSASDGTSRTAFSPRMPINKQGLWHLMQQLVDLELLGETVKRLESAWDWKAGLRQTPGRGNI